MAQDKSMKTMRLYDQVERILNELHHLGIDEESPLNVEDLTPFDQYHYHGTAAVDQAARMLGATADTQILEIGSGIGGPARHMAHVTGCRVTAVELQPDLSALSEQLTSRCGLSGQIDHVFGQVNSAQSGSKRAKLRTTEAGPAAGIKNDSIASCAWPVGWKVINWSAKR